MTPGDSLPAIIISPVTVIITTRIHHDNRNGTMSHLRHASVNPCTPTKQTKYAVRPDQTAAAKTRRASPRTILLVSGWRSLN